LERHHLFASDNGVSVNLRQEIEAAFGAAIQNPALIAPLGRTLQQKGLFAEYEDRFFSLVKAHHGKQS
jgi:hypothetical protein